MGATPSRPGRGPRGVRRVRVLVVGGGAREHALAWRVSREPGVRVWAAPGNPGLAPVAMCAPVQAGDAAGLADVVRREGIDLVVVGPEAPLVAGVADALRARGVAVLGPSAAAARIEGSKRWAREFCARHRIPAPAFEVAVGPAEADALATRWPLPAVIKADGLMAGKGVVVAETREGAREAARRLAAAGPVVFEEYLRGAELSAFALCDGRRHAFYGLARDHKRIGDGDRGPMTGGMGAFAPVPDADADVRDAVAGVLATACEALAAEGTPFVGFLYAGLMVTADGPRVLEFNCRLGDPEAQVLLPLLTSPIADVWLAAARGGLGPDAAAEPAWASGAALGVVLASPGYPEAPEPGQPIEGLDADGQVEGAPPGTLCFHAATRRDGRGWRTAGGRVLTVVGRGTDLAAARRAAYEGVARVSFEGMRWRRDVGAPPASA
jgi:phosphoribosylamine--glycine ligase